MNSTCRTAVAAAVAGGYVLGRTRKAKMAFAVGTFLAGRRFGLTPAALAAEGLRRLRETPQLAGLREQIGGDLLDAARAAATSSADRRFSAFADTLRERGHGELLGDEPEDEDSEEEDEDEDAEEAGEDGGGEKPAARRRTSRKKAPAKKAAARKTGPAKKAAASGKSAAKKTAKKAAKKAAKKTAPGHSRSTASRSGR